MFVINMFSAEMKLTERQEDLALKKFQSMPLYS